MQVIENVNPNVAKVEFFATLGVVSGEERRREGAEGEWSFATLGGIVTGIIGNYIDRDF